MPMYIRGVDLVRRMKERSLLLKENARTIRLEAKQTVDGINAAIPASMRAGMAQADAQAMSMVEGAALRNETMADDLEWLAAVIVEDKTHIINASELECLGVIKTPIGRIMGMDISSED